MLRSSLLYEELTFSYKVKRECKGFQAIMRLVCRRIGKEPLCGYKKMSLFGCKTVVGTIRGENRDKVTPGEVWGSAVKAEI